ncbi:hypothetical protein SLEP1_g37888 [Rubroshorea leprosula]|uniref:Integrase catalytic domain-containing protein n=1 Tax=Rubroshorea leprosula TaxID=152421 RepID=A0AAV5KW69_9ROSI|nr:hypothetical protein SLEP1_g37888 [Rubroshorea leprosula]
MDQLNGTDDDERTPTGYAAQPEQSQIPTGTRQRHPRSHNPHHERPERSTEPARTTELEERTRVLEMAMGKILARLIPDDPLIPLLNRDAQPAVVVTTQNSPALSNIVVPTKPRGSGKLNNEPSLSKHSEELLKKNADLERQLRDVQRSIDKLKKPYQEGFKIPHLETYDGSGDPDEHLNTYQAIMRIQNANNAMMCKVFPATLKSTARRWYHKLPRHSIDSYAQLAKLFSNKFASQREIKRTATELMQVHQKEGESLRDYMQRFNKATLDIDNVPDTICLLALLHGLKPGRFLDNLLENPPKSWNEVNDRSASFILSEDFQSSKRRADDRQGKEPKQLEGRDDKKKQKVGEQRGKQPSYPKYDSYIPLNSPRSQILAQIQHWVKRPPPQMHDSSRADRSKYCDYHRGYGHITKDCQSLKDELEFLARSGKFEGYVQKPYVRQPTQTHFVQEYGRSQAPRYQIGANPNPYQAGQYSSEPNRAYKGRPFNSGIPPLSGTINMISGGAVQRGGVGECTYYIQPGSYKRAEGEPDIMMPHADPFVATVHIGNHNVNKVFIDTGSSPDILYWSCFQRMQLNLSLLQKYEGPIYGFDKLPVLIEGVVTLPIYVGSEPRFRMASVSFLVVKMESAFNTILGRATLCELRAVISQPHLSGGFENNRPTQLGQQIMSISDIEHRPEGVEQKVELVEPVETIPLNLDVLERTVKIGTRLTEEERAELLECLRTNQDVFAWSMDEMPCILADIAVHKLCTNPTIRPVVQKRRLFGLEKQAAIDEEIQKLLQAGFIRRVEYSEWVSNPVLVKKPNGKWRMCIDFTNLNEACPKDPHPLPNVEKLVERAAGHERMSFLDTSLGYHQVQLLLDDQEKTAFYAEPAPSTYQKLVQVVFKLQIDKNIEVYVDDMIVTSKRAEDHIAYLNETFQNLRRAQMKLNPFKCTFAVESGKFLGYVVSKKGIEVNPKTVQAVQFIARLAEMCLLFFKALREPKNFWWTNECQQAFEELKQYLTSAPLLSKPVEGENLYLYLGVSEEAVSPVLLREENKNQKPICYVSKVLQGAEQNYPLTEKAVFALVYIARKLRAYFQSHQIIVYTDLPLRKILQKLELSSRLIRWSVELSEYDLRFQPCTTIKGQAIADFLVECLSATAEERTPEYPTWILYVDGVASIEGSGVGAMLVGLDGFKSEHALRFKFQTMNNAAEYEALIYGLKLASELKAQTIQVFSDSQLVVGQVNGSCEIRDPQLGRYASVDINRQRSTFVEVLDASSYTNFTIESQLLSTDPFSPSWTTPLIEYLHTSMPLLRCLTPYEAEYAMREVHEGVCGTHIGGKTLAQKLLRHGYYWPTMVEDAQSYVKRCPTCQFNANDIHMLGEMFSPLSSPWPFAQWGVDLLGPFVKGKEGCTYLVVAVDYFTKWIEAKPLSMTTERKIEEFLFNSILCRFGIPKQIIADNGPQFRAAALRSLCDDYGIELALTSIYTPQSNRQAESANKIVLRGLKTCVLTARSNWVDELNKVFWSCRTTPSSATGETPFSLAYGAKAVIPVEVGLSSDRAGQRDDPNNEQLLRENIDLIEEVREMSRIRNMAYQGRVAKFYNKRVRARQFQVGDLVLRKAGLTNAYSHLGKLAPNWEGPYMVVQVNRPGSYTLADMHGHQLPFTWNVQNLRKFYS